MSGTAALHVFAIRRRNCVKKIGHEPSGRQSVKSQEISVCIMLSCWISSINVNHLSRTLYPDIYSLQILSFNSSYAIIER